MTTWNFLVSVACGVVESTDIAERVSSQASAILLSGMPLPKFITPDWNKNATTKKHKNPESFPEL